MVTASIRRGTGAAPAIAWKHVMVAGIEAGAAISGSLAKRTDPATIATVCFPSAWRKPGRFR
jgi:hypothetical protein